MSVPSHEINYGANKQRPAGHHQLGSVVLGGEVGTSGLPAYDMEGVDPKYYDLVEATMKQQYEALVALPTNTEGINLERAHEYLARAGMPTRPILVFDQDVFARAVTLGASEDFAEARGKFLASLGVSIVKRDPSYEQLNGSPEITESDAVHEGVHGSGILVVGIRVWAEKKLLRGTEITIEPYKKRAGYIEVLPDGTVKGLLIEEGHAELERGIYMVDELHRPQGFVGSPERYGPVAKYGYASERHGINIREGVAGALIFELLAERDPDLLTTLRQDRFSSVPGMKLKTHMDTLVPGLYDEMNKVDVKTAEGRDRTSELYRHLSELRAV